MKISKDVVYAGVADTEIDLFESQYEVPDGVTYNSYVICDEKTAVMDTVDARKTDEWMKHLKEILGERKPSYLVVSHVEPDQAGRVGCGECQDLSVPVSVFPKVEGEDAYGDGFRGRGFESRKAQPAVFHGAYGSLAGGHGFL